jgi:hypothetical protein
LTIKGILRILELKFRNNYQKTQNRIVQSYGGIYQEYCKLLARNQKGMIAGRWKKVKINSTLLKT